MKTPQIILSLVILLMLVFSACREVVVTTKVNRDGSFTRIITVTGDSSEIRKTDLPFPVDGTWDVKFAKDSTDSAKFVATYIKTFRNSDELNDEIKGDTSFYSKVKREVTIKKRFGFFYTWLSFREVYASMNPFTYLDYHDYLTEEEIQYYNGQKKPVSPSDSASQDQANEKAEDFIAASAVAEIESILRYGILRLGHPYLDTGLVSCYHDSLVSRLAISDLAAGEDIIEYYRQISGIDSFLLLADLEPPIFEEFDQKFKALQTIITFEDYTQVVEMPGLITATNSEMLQGNRVSWDFHAGLALLSDYEMIAESRVINYWAFVLAGAILLALVILLVVKAFK